MPSHRRVYATGMDTHFMINGSFWAGERAQPPKALAALPEDQSPVPSTHMTASRCVYHQFQGVWCSLPSSMNTRYARGARTYMQTKPPTHKNKLFFFKSEFPHLSLSMWCISSSSCVIFMAVVMVLAVNNRRDSPAGRQLESLLHTSTCSSPLYPLRAFFRTLKE